MTPRGIDDLFVRYWDNALSERDAEEFERRLAENPAELEVFRLLTYQAVTAADLGGVGHTHAPQPVPQVRQPSRRLAFRYAIGGLSAAAAGGLFAAWATGGGASAFSLVAAHGKVRMQTADGKDIAPTGLIPPGGTISTTGIDASAVLSLPGGGTVTLPGDSAVTVASQGLRLVLRWGYATAQVSGRSKRLELVTSAATLTNLAEALITVGHGFRETEVGVRVGSVTVSSSAGERIGVVREGEMMTVRTDGERATRPLPSTPDEFAWDLSVPLPDGWPVGTREVGAEGPVLRPDFWFDPYHQTRMWQIRSEQQWATGHCKLYPDSVVRVRYRADRAGPGEVVLCVRQDQLPKPDTGVLGCVKPITPTAPGEWGVWEATVADLLTHHNHPKFGAPWVGFLGIVNTYTADLGLRVAEFRVTRPGGHHKG